MQRKEITNSVFFTHIPVPKLKTACVSINFVLPLAQATAAHIAVLPAILKQGCDGFENITKLSAEMDRLYGARIEPLVRKFGDHLAVGFICDVIDNSMSLEGEDLLGDLAGLLSRLLFYPLKENDGFLPGYTQREKQQLKEKIEGQINDKRSYALKRLVELMCEGEVFAKNELGNLSDIPSITPQSAYESYKQLLKTARVEIICCSASESNAFEALFGGGEKGGMETATTEIIRSCNDVTTVVEELDVSQGKLSLGFRTGIVAGEADYCALTVVNALFGGSINSKLFNNVREKLSLCYYASSSVSKYKGILTVSSGIENEKYEIAKAAILKEFSDLQQGNFTAEELDSGIKTIKNSIKSMESSGYAMEGYWAGHLICGVNETPATLYAAAEAVTREAVIRVAKGITLDTVYFMKGVQKDA